MCELIYYVCQDVLLDNYWKVSSSLYHVLSDVLSANDNTVT